MESTGIDFVHLSEPSDMTQSSPSKKPPYVSFIKINGKPILPPLIDEERRKEMQKFKQKAIELELKLAKLKKKESSKLSQIPSEVSSIDNVPPNHQSTPARPATLNLNERGTGRAFALSKSQTEGSLNKFFKTRSSNFEMLSSHNSAKNLDKLFRTSLEQRLASEDTVNVKNLINNYQQSPITEENFPEKIIDSDRKIWSPLHMESINSLKIELPTKDTHEADEIPLDDCQITPETVTHSPSLVRQNSYTLLTPSPALLQFLESQKDDLPRSQSGRKTWDLRKAKKNWDPKNGQLGKSSDEDGNEENFLNRKNSSSLESLSMIQNNSIDYAEYSQPNSLAYDGGSSPESSSLQRTPKTGKVKSKLKGKKSRSSKSVPLPTDDVPFKNNSKSTQGSSINCNVGNDISDLSNLLLKIKVDYERQKRELEEKQMSEMKKLEILFQRREAELLSKVSQIPKKNSKSIYTQSYRDLWPQELEYSHNMGDGRHANNDRNVSSFSEHLLSQFGHGKRPQSAKDFHPQLYYQNDCNRRTRSMDFNQGCQDTDLDVSFQDDFMHSKDTTLNNEYFLESDSISNFSSRSSTVSSDNRHDIIHPSNLKKFQGLSSEEFAKYNQAAMKITAAAKGFLTRRLLRTAHVQGLITTLRDAINCATQLHTASDIADSDIDLMRRLGRQIEAAWDAVYAVFFNTETTARLQLIAADRERLRAAITKTPLPGVKKKRISSATKKSLDRKKGGSLMSKSQTSNAFGRVRMCTKMAASYPSPYFPQKLK